MQGMLHLTMLSCIETALSPVGPVSAPKRQFHVLALLLQDMLSPAMCSRAKAALLSALVLAGESPNDSQVTECSSMPNAGHAEPGDVQPCQGRTAVGAGACRRRRRNRRCRLCHGVAHLRLDRCIVEFANPTYLGSERAVIRPVVMGILLASHTSGWAGAVSTLFLLDRRTVNNVHC